jgi:hypothetical protein
VNCIVKSSRQKTGKSLQRLDSGVALPSIATEGASPNSRDLELKVLCIILESLLYETLSGDKLYLAFSKAKQEIDKMQNPRAAKLFEKLILLADKKHKKNPLYGAFGI